MCGYSDVIDMLIDAGDNVNTLFDCATVLMIAVRYGQSESVRKLLNRGAIVDMTDERGLTALHKAAFMGNLECMKILIDNKAEVNKVDSSGRTALMVAVCFYQPDAVK